MIRLEKNSLPDDEVEKSERYLWTKVYVEMIRQRFPQEHAVDAASEAVLQMRESFDTAPKDTAK